ncbi:Succinate dehydrogenase assembly factor 4, mitochondrial [Armadillidium nasatum]|uniref:Succinate dehydrogenase assembly factor 4, mitochondrial n=1 Tax=Armadillidium nasatum TaxID=96803 RepID=A0A5N5T1P7_9CRUS|nr:Succinate dehydrogenase assembly factor 4, mitochondrial [Armadillidium nasatum]
MIKRKLEPQVIEGRHPYQEKEPLQPFPDNINPETGEIGGPRGPEPTRYGDWERKGRKFVTRKNEIYCYCFIELTDIGNSSPACLNFFIFALNFTIL